MRAEVHLVLYHLQQPYACHRISAVESGHEQKGGGLDMLIFAGPVV